MDELLLMDRIFMGEVEKMSRIQRILTVIILMGAVLAVTFRAGVAAGAQNGTPGSVNDPLITKSYLDARLAQLEKESGGSTGNAMGAGMTKLTLTKGTIVSGAEGTMFVLISGSASAGGNGMVNITGGESLSDGMTISKYNTYLSTDSTGAIRAESSAVVFVSGSYEEIR